MSRFRQADDRTIPFSEIKPERFDPRVLGEPQDKRRADELRRVFMEEIPLLGEVEFDAPRQLKGNR